MLAEFEIKNLASKILFCLAILVFFIENKKLNNNKLEQLND